MRVECPRCAARYDVPDDRMLAGRAMRCARCGTDWVPDLVEPEPVSPALAAPELAEPKSPRPHPFMGQARPAIDTMAEASTGAATSDAPLPDDPSSVAAAPVGRPKRSPALAIAWAASIAVLAAAGAAFVTHRSAVEQAWPASTRLFAWLGTN